MPTYEIKPQEGIGPVRFGMGQREVYAAVPERPRPYRRTRDASHPADAFDAAGLHVHYGGMEPVVEVVEATLAPDVTVTLRGVDVFGQPAEAVVAALAAQTNVVTEEHGRVVLLPEWDVSLWRASAESERFTTVGAAAPGFDHLAAV
ncbi:MAG TPA: hypothetical protein VD962_03310 [Rubricoccaceae bacterium]|nr:hypothetical protein [Rubricoccaceae bacterium]